MLREVVLIYFGVAYFSIKIDISEVDYYLQP